MSVGILLLNDVGR